MGDGSCETSTAQNQIREANPDSTTHSTEELVIECDPSLHANTEEGDVQDSIVSSSESEVVYSSNPEDVHILVSEDEQDNLPDPRLELTDKQFNLKMKELSSQAPSG